MGILSGDKIKQRVDEDEIIELKTFNKDCLDPAAYSMRLDDKYILIDGVKYDDKNPYAYDKNDGFIILPSRKISVLSTIEKLNLSDDLCAKVGIAFTWSKKGLIPLFGPQVDPGTKDYFYAVVYNASNEDVKLKHGDRLFKIEFNTIDGDANTKTQLSTYKSPGIGNIDSDITKEDSVGDLKNNIMSIEQHLERLIKDVKKNNIRVEEVTSGYKTIVWFGVFLISASVFGVVLTIMLSFEKSPHFIDFVNNRELSIIIIFVIVLFLTGWILTVYAVIRNISNRGSG